MNRLVPAAIFVALAASVVSACGKSRPSSDAKESPDSDNSLTKFDIFKTYTYDELRRRSQVERAVMPWSDIYWPLVDHGMAQRWMSWPEPAALGEGEIGIGSFFNHLAAQTEQAKPDPALSPAEKYDLLFRYRQGLNVPSARIKELARKLGERDRQLKAEPQIEKKRELLQALAEQFLSQDSEALAQSLPMTAASWKAFIDANLDTHNRYLNRESAAGIDWSWQGHCDGWAGAAASMQAPSHAVLAVAGDQRVFFSEGDLRGLISKAWSDSPPLQHSYFAGRRCYEKEQSGATAPANSSGRAYSGRLKEPTSNRETPFIVLEQLPALFQAADDGSSEALATPLNLYRIRLETSGEKRLLLERAGATPEDSRFWLAETFAQVAAAARAGGSLRGFAKVQAVLTGCFDINPSTFHVVLLEQLGTRKSGLVMDRTRTAQVWNQPIHSAAFSLGRLQPAGRRTDVAARYRASGTVSIAVVQATVLWIAEPGRPSLSYGSGFERRQLRSSTYDYTLEFDADQRLIGGEWGLPEEIDPAAEVPDFLYAYPLSAKPHDNLSERRASSTAPIDFTGIIGKLHNCSLDARIDGQFDLLGRSLPYTECHIDRSGS